MDRRARAQPRTFRGGGAVAAGAALASLLGSTYACGGVTPAPQLLVEARALETRRQDTEMHRRRQHYTLSAALAVPFERDDRAPVASAATPLGADELTDAELTTIPLDELALATADAELPIRGATGSRGPDAASDGELHAAATPAARASTELQAAAAPAAAAGDVLHAAAATADSGVPRSSRDLRAEPVPATETSSRPEPQSPAVRAARAQADARTALDLDRATSDSPRQRIEPDGSEPLEDQPRASEIDLETVRRLQARYAREPTAAQVARAAARAIAGDPQRFESMVRRARWRGIVPDLALGARRGQGIDLRSMLIQDETARFTSGDDLVLSATLRFELGRLLFAPEEIAIAREARVARATGLDLVRDIVHWYAVRRRLLLERDLLGHTSLARESRIAELEALLDIFTNGAFGRMIAGRAAWTTGESTPASRPP